jgi:5-methylcytosine-specific restriction enzyme B
MVEHFTSDHFEHLNKWQGQKRDNSNPEQNHAYDDLKKAYELTELWAKVVQSRMFPEGWCSIRKRPTNQANNFFPYTWAKIFPQKSSPKELAYTVGIDAQSGFIVKIDTVSIDDAQELRKKYLSIRGNRDGTSPIIATLPASEGVSKSFSELVEWSMESFRTFAPSYDEVAIQLGLQPADDNSSILEHFKGHPEFVRWQPKWGEENTSLFCRFVQAVHESGLDVWFTKGATGQVRFGRKDKEWQRGKIGGWICFRSDGLELSWKAIGKLAAKEDWTFIGAELVEVMEQFSSTPGEGELLKLYGNPNRSLPYWPDDYEDLFGDEGDLPATKKGKAEASPLVARPAFNRIYYGPPGTGKTYQLLNLLQDRYTDTQVKEDPEGWIVDQVRERTWFQIIALILLEAGKPIKVADIVGHRFYQAKAKANGRTGNLTQTAWGYLQRHTWSKSTTVDYALARRAEIAVFDKDDGINWFIVDELREQLADLVPALAALHAGPESGAIKKRYAFVTFHQSYGYEEFVEGLRPELGNDATDQVCYEISQGALRKLCSQAEADPINFYAMVIDEINRGNISKIFGELITLIEIDKRAGSELAVPVALPYSGDPFIIPPNVDFIGTMNTADRSLALVDTALRRRFEFVPVLPKAEVLADLIVIEQGVTINVQQLLVAMNNRIEALYDRDHTIGHAYFTQLLKLEPAGQFKALKGTFQNKIIPLLEEYFFEDWQKIRLVLGDNQKEEAFQFVRAAGREEDLLELFGLNHELDQYATRARFRLNEASLDIPQAYAGIYGPAGSPSSL